MNSRARSIALTSLITCLLSFAPFIFNYTKTIEEVIFIIATFFEASLIIECTVLFWQSLWFFNTDALITN